MPRQVSCGRSWVKSPPQPDYRDRQCRYDREEKRESDTRINPHPPKASRTKELASRQGVIIEHPLLTSAGEFTALLAIVGILLSFDAHAAILCGVARGREGTVVVPRSNSHDRRNPTCDVQWREHGASEMFEYHGFGSLTRACESVAGTLGATSSEDEIHTKQTAAASMRWLPTMASRCISHCPVWVKTQVAAAAICSRMPPGAPPRTASGRILAILPPRTA